MDRFIDAIACDNACECVLCVLHLQVACKILQYTNIYPSLQTFRPCFLFKILPYSKPGSFHLSQTSLTHISYHENLIKTSCTVLSNKKSYPRLPCKLRVQTDFRVHRGSRVICFLRLSLQVTSVILFPVPRSSSTDILKLLMQMLLAISKTTLCTLCTSSFPPLAIHPHVIHPLKTASMRSILRITSRS